ncbi:hypothetical protein SShM2_071 [Synechococcus phage S-ShM2]|uniref:Uncharacterized protein n=3 Tax=Ahtivirus sagseatwo TaxID=2734079 RepID=A0A1D7SM56_9CAUD|nr:hypothetical protein SShM2_071 [Synechococcus phage S-ShM2]AGH57273.1 hypothetical protein CPLG_00019 [Cyanophage S-SSM2]AOO13181.1 hypothetical protein LIS021110_067 [Cyanophage S-RIM14]ADO97682.1 hypothetical protein SShM2_071 [Synechococcus phage S-ShM2]AOO13397.1 hypothetical protein LIS110610_067 [Cyanophage S-RIM14]AOO13613.1 hypothetical protein Np111211_067 [Cyanophage S-RIM14]
MARRVIITPDQREEMLDIYVERLVERLTEDDLERYVTELFLEQFEESTDKEVMETCYRSFRRENDFRETFGEVLDDNQMDQIANKDYGEDADMLDEEYDPKQQLAQGRSISQYSKYDKVTLDADDDDDWV